MGWCTWYAVGVALGGWGDGWLDVGEALAGARGREGERTR